MSTYINKKKSISTQKCLPGQNTSQYGAKTRGLNQNLGVPLQEDLEGLQLPWLNHSQRKQHRDSEAV